MVTQEMQRPVWQIETSRKATDVVVRQSCLKRIGRAEVHREPAIPTSLSAGVEFLLVEAGDGWANLPTIDHGELPLAGKLCRFLWTGCR